MHKLNTHVTLSICMQVKFAVSDLRRKSDKTTFAQNRTSGVRKPHTTRLVVKILHQKWLRKKGRMISQFRARSFF